MSPLVEIPYFVTFHFTSCLLSLPHYQPPVKHPRTPHRPILRSQAHTPLPTYFSKQKCNTHYHLPIGSLRHGCVTLLLCFFYISFYFSLVSSLLILASLFISCIILFVYCCYPVTATFFPPVCITATIVFIDDVDWMTATRVKGIQVTYKKKALSAFHVIPCEQIH